MPMKNPGASGTAGRFPSAGGQVWVPPKFPTNPATQPSFRPRRPTLTAPRFMPQTTRQWAVDNALEQRVITVPATTYPQQLRLEVFQDAPKSAFFIDATGLINPSGVKASSITPFGWRKPGARRFRHRAYDQRFSTFALLVFLDFGEADTVVSSLATSALVTYRSLKPASLSLAVNDLGDGSNGAMGGVFSVEIFRCPDRGPS
jgi:hypothetical protein